MKQLAQLVENQENAGQIYYACNVRNVIQPVRVRLVSVTEIYKNVDHKDFPLMAVIVYESDEIPVPSKFNTIPISCTVLFDTYEEASFEFSKYWKIH
ncbi:hypothetical protein GAP32_137 [Cronobacter phage vB_CsaM_GAP32]|uniref:Uncharacterized protein n=1 Tax=Cronobacter phage vB_CsaM_GAP32 TaxID=1141136 RepID=K4F7B0_9CAUD|nr:hypothetical protein GAP32_137 [Cronobacter phage vB_CsaM_GAP32]AFC21587.1 hypothetical protein GAP32_137 [Cronobacter phage vB_CsaM_GAP32]